MPERTPTKATFEKGYWPTQMSFIPGTLIDALNLYVRSGGRLETSKGFGANGSSGGVGVLQALAGTHGGLSTNGSITQAFGAGVYFFAGSGTAFVGGVSKGAAGSSVTIYTGSTTVNAGFASVPTAPTIGDSGGPGHNNGAYSIALTAIRSSTGAESSMGAPSNVISVANHGINIINPSPLPIFTLPAGADKIGIYGTRRGFGSSGPYFHLYDVAWPQSLPYPIQIPGDTTAGWFDGQLGDLAPLDYNPPPPCTFVLAMNTVIVAVGCYGGAGLSPSYPNKPEAYPPQFVVFIPGGGTVTACKSTGIEGAVLVATTSSMNLVNASGSPTGPIQIRQIWPTTGVLSGDQFCVAEDEIYAFLGGRGAVRSSIGAYSGQDLGDDASSFAEPVTKAFNDNGFTAGNTTVAYDPKNDAVWYMAGTVGVSYCRNTGKWNSVHTLPVTITTATTVANDMLASDSAGNLYTPEKGAGTTWYGVPAFQGGSTVNYPKTLVRLAASASESIRLDVLNNPDNLSSIATGGSNITAGGPFSRFKHLNIPNLSAYSIKFSGTDSGGQTIRLIEAQHVEHPVSV